MIERLTRIYFAFLCILKITAYSADLWNASVDPESFSNATEIARRWGYATEVYDVTTEDGYILELIRILPNYLQYRSSAPVIFLQHGLESSCVDWINNLPGQSAGFYFSDSGFDVWLGNFRGNRYSRRHNVLKPEDDEFWKFTWDEMAKYDLPALIGKALEVANSSRLYYVGHSQGTLAAFTKFSTDQALSNTVRAFFALAPVFTLKHIQGPLRYVAKIAECPEILTNLCGKGEFLPNKEFISMIAEKFCPRYIAKDICSNMMFLIFGADSHQLNETRIPVYLAHNPSGTSTKNALHFGQMVNTGRCEMYDYGSPKENQKHYDGRSTPPEYHIANLHIPTVLFYSATDNLATAADVEESIIGKVQSIVRSYKFSDFNHMDFIWGLRAAHEIYRPIEKYIQNDILQDQIIFM